MDIVFLTDQLMRGGAETQLVRIATSLNRRGWSVGIMTMLPTEEIWDDIQKAEIPHFICSKRLPMFQRFPLLLAIRMALQLRRWRPTVLITFNYHSDILGRICGSLVGVPAIVASQRTAHVKTIFREKVYRLTEWMIQMTASNSRAAITYMLNRGILHPSKTAVIPNGVITSSFPHSISREAAREEFTCSPDTFIWLAVGNLRPAKDYLTLLEAAERCHAASSNFQLLIAGSGEQEAALLDDICHRGLNENVRLLGTRTDIPQLLRACDALVNSSAWEGMPNAVMEAMASGVPVVSTDAGGVSELLLENICGYLVPTRNPQALSERMIGMMMLCEEERFKMGAAGRERISRHFDNELVLNQWETLIRQVIRTTSTAPKNTENKH